MHSIVRDLRTDALVLFGIFVAAICLRVYFFAGYVGLDDGEYSRFAYELAGDRLAIGTYSGPAVFPLRIGVIAPVSWAIRLWGFGEWSIAVYPLLLSIVGILLSYLCASMLFNHRVGLIAAAVHAIVPLDISNATVLYPDLPAAVFASLGVIAVIALTRYFIENKSVLLAGGLFAGLAFGISWLCKETVSYFVLTCAVFMVMSLKRSWHSAVVLWMGVALGSILVLVGEMVAYHHLTGNWLYRFDEIERNYGQWQNGFFTEGSSFGWPKGGSRTVALMKRLFMKGPEFLLLNSAFLFLPLLGIIACFHAFYWKDRAFLIPSLWLITLLLMFNFASSSRAAYSPVPLFERYFYPVIFPSVLLVSGFLGKLIFPDGSGQGIDRERRFWGGVLISFVLVVGGASLYWQERVPLKWTSEIRAISGMIKPSSHLYSDLLTLRGLEFFGGYPPHTAWVDFEEIDSIEEIQPGSLVMVNSRYLRWLDINKGMWLSKSSGYKNHEFYEHPPLLWKKLFENGNAVLYEVR
ncbi:MAG: glycosyltransferase family 39 protein [Nitrospira sp.]|nr:glycosyltransferase family 39 protein [Nitrospira sp.]